MGTKGGWAAAIACLFCAALPLPEQAQAKQANWVNITSPVYARTTERIILVCQASLSLISCVIEGPNGQNFQVQDDIVISPLPGAQQAGSNKDGFCGIQINNVAEKDNGNWTCTVIPSGAVQLTAALTLFVLKKPQNIYFIPKGPIEYTDQDGKREKVHIGCVVYGGRPPANLSWYIDEFPVIGIDRLGPIEHQPLPDNAGYITTQNFTGSFIPDDNERHLRCVASHPAFQPGDNNSTDAEIIVNYPPLEWTEPVQTLYGFTNGVEGTLKVNVSANPMPTIVWTLPNGELLKNRAVSSDKRISSNRPQHKGRGIYEMQLTLNPVEESDVNGQFQLAASNDFGTRTYYVKISSEAAPPQGLAAGAIVGIVIGIPAFLLIVALLVFARATGRWCFKEPPRKMDRESQPCSEHENFITCKISDTESTGHDVVDKKPQKLTSRLSSFLPKKKEKTTSATEMESAVDQTKPEEPPKVENPDGIVYAELDLKQSSRPLIRKEEENTEYAEIIGTVKPENPEVNGK